MVLDPKAPTKAFLSTDGCEIVAIESGLYMRYVLLSYVVDVTLSISV